MPREHAAPREGLLAVPASVGGGFRDTLRAVIFRQRAGRRTGVWCGARVFRIACNKDFISDPASDAYTYKSNLDK